MRNISGRATLPDPTVMLFLLTICKLSLRTRANELIYTLDQHQRLTETYLLTPGPTH